MAREKLSDRKVKALNKPGRYGDGGGLWLQVRAADQKSWLFRYTFDSKQRQLGLGPFPLIGLKDAREKALAAARAVHDGSDPIATKHAKKRASKAPALTDMTFKAVADLYLAAHEPTWRNPQHRWQWRQTLEAHAYPVFGDWQVSAIDTGAVMKAIEPIWREVPETATRVRGRIETILDYAKARGWRTGDNPARWRGHIANLLPARAKVAKVEHHAALPWPEISGFLAELANQGGVAAKALRFTILTAARTTEALEARWNEIDLTSAVWTVPPDRMKAAREHRVPLTPEVLAVLSAVNVESADRSALVFEGATPGRPLSNTAMLMLLRRMKRADLTVHGFRSTFRDWAGEATNYPRELAEAALAHVLKDKTEAAYARGDALEKRRQLMTDWAKFCAGSVSKDAAPPRQIKARMKMQQAPLSDLKSV